MFDRTVTNKKDVINIYTLISQISATKNFVEYVTLAKSRVKEIKLEPPELPEIFVNNWEDLLPNTLQDQISLKLEYDKISHKEIHITLKNN